MTDLGFVKIIHPETGNTAVVPESSLPHHYRAGWALLDETPEPDPEPPRPVRASAAKAKAEAAAAAGAGTTREGE
jgi:hypothetical protein